ncbi:MAG: hypothetical protein ACXVJP_17195, partial [Mucilaginibacter sp.]
MKNKCLIWICLLFCFPLPGFSQADKKIDSLKKVVQRVPGNDKVRKAVELIYLGQQYVNKSDY